MRSVEIKERCQSELGGSGSGDLEGNATTSPLVRASDHIVGKSLIFISPPPSDDSLNIWED